MTMLRSSKVSIFFLPLTFVTSVFGMTNMPTEHHFVMFGVVMVTVCLPFFILIGSLNTTSGMEFWRGKWHQFVHWTRTFKRKQKSETKEDEHDFKFKERSYSTSRSMEIRRAQLRPPSSPRLNAVGRLSTTSISSVKAQYLEPHRDTNGESQRGKERPEVHTNGATSPARQETVSPTASWRESVFGRKRREDLPI